MLVMHNGAKMCIWVVRVKERKKKKIRLTDLFFPRHVTVNTPMFLALVKKKKLVEKNTPARAKKVC